MGGGIQKRIYLVEHQSRLETSEKRQRITQDTGGWIALPTPNTGRGGDYRKPKPQICHRSKLAQNAISIPTKRTFGERYQKSEWNAMWKETIGFSQSSSSDRLTDEQREDLIAENIYDWWISGKSYKKWYADKFLQLKFEFEE